MDYKLTNLNEYNYPPLPISSYQFHKLFYKLFHTGDGKKCLDYLEAVYIKQASAHPSGTHASACYREGENSVVRKFILWANIAPEQEQKNE